MSKIWRLLPASSGSARTLAGALGILPLTAQLLLHRGLEDPEAARRFLHPNLDDLHHPSLLPDMNAGVERLAAALRNGERILIFGDYDVDGLTSISLLMRLLKPAAKGEVYYYAPKRLEEGYGLSLGALKRAAARGVTLVVTVDCGVTACTEVAAAKEMGVDVIVTDHHEPGAELPAAAAVIDPKLPGSAYPFPGLAGVGVAFKLGQALAARGLIDPAVLHQYLDLVALGTVADVVPLIDENRVLVHYGLDRLNQTDHPGLRALLEVTRLHDREVTAGHIGFVLAPRLNAAGRLGDANAGIRLLLTNDAERGREIARALDQENRRRQRIEAEVLVQAKAMVERDYDLERERALVLAAPEWHPGVIGIAASRLVEEYCRPVILIAMAGEEGRGSGRSIPGFNLFAGLTRCAGLLERFGGHEVAAGLSIHADRVGEFTQEFLRVAREEIQPGALLPTMRVDAEVGLSDIGLELARELARLAPHGPGNPTPVLACRDVEVVGCRGVGEDCKHLKLQVAQAGVVRDSIGFNLGASLTEVAKAARLDLAFVIEENTYNGSTSVQLNLRDLIHRVTETEGSHGDMEVSLG